MKTGDKTFRFLSLCVLFLLLSLFLTSSHAYAVDMGFTLDFEEGNARGWAASGNAFNFQPTLNDNSKTRLSGPSNHQGKYWIGTYEKYQGASGQYPGSIQGDGPTGTLTSAAFKIPKGTLSFLIGGGNSFDTRVEFLVKDTIEGLIRVVFESGRNSETMHRVTWELDKHAGKTGVIRIVDLSSKGWGHINVDDFRFSANEKVELLEVIPMNEGAIIREIRPASAGLTAKINPENITVEQGKDAVFKSQSLYDPDSRLVRQSWTGPEEQNKEGDSFIVKTGKLKAGTYKIILQITDSRKRSSRASATLEVVLPPSKPKAMIIPEEQKVESGETAVFESVSSHDPKTDIREIWIGLNKLRHKGRVFKINTDGLDPGVYKIGLSVIDSNKQSDSASAILKVVAPVKYRAVIEADQYEISRGQEVIFMGFVDPPAPDIEYRFDFGDGRVSPWTIESEVSHRYREPSNYRVFVSIRKDGDTITRSNILRISVTHDISYRVQLEADSELVMPGREVIFKGFVVPLPEEAAYRLDFGDGRWVDGLIDPAASHSYSGTGTYEAILTARIGDETVQSDPVTIDVSEFNLYITADRGHTGAGQPIVFSAVMDWHSEDLEYRFVFGNGELSDWSRKASIKYAYPDPGVYQVYVLTRRGGDMVSESSPIMINISAQNDWINWAGVIAGALILLTGGSYLLRTFKGSGKGSSGIDQLLSIRPQTDMGTQSIDQPDSLRSGLQLKLRAVIDKGKQTIESKKPLIKTERGGQ